MSDNEYAASGFSAVMRRIDKAVLQAGRLPHEVKLIGAAKQQSVSNTSAAVRAGLSAVGHNYLQEALAMKPELSERHPGLEWHFFGSIQSNKTKEIAEHFDWVQSIDRLKIARRLSDHRSSSADDRERLNLLVQINIDGETSKSGITPDQAPELCEQIANLPAVKLRGFMVIPKPRASLEAQRVPFTATRELLNDCNRQLSLQMDTLSMGMSNDLEAAILEGSTMVRVGTALFGSRRKHT